jgi:hypothetical protein
MVSELVGMQLEKSGLNPDSAVGQLVETRRVDQEQHDALTMTLLLASVLNEKVVSELPQQTPNSFEFTPYLYYLPENAVVIWKELGRLVLCVTRQEHPVYFHALTGSELNPQAVSEIESLMMPLHLQGVVGTLSRIVLWTNSVEPGAEQMLAETLQLPLRRDIKPAPAPPAQKSLIEPTSVALEKIRHARMQKIRKIATAAVAAYLAVAGGLVGKYLWNLKKNDDLSAEIKRLEPSVEFVPNTMRRWELSAPLRNRDQFQIEIARRVLEPSFQYYGNMRITEYRWDQNGIEVKGEASQQAIGSQYRNALSQSKELESYDWAMPTWGPKRGEQFSFTISAKRKGKEDKENAGT